MKILVIADIDDLHWKHGVGKADLLLSCGDVSDQVIIEAAEAYGCKVIFAVKGNHDSTDSFLEPIVDLHLKMQEYNGVKFGGLNGAWKYKPRGPFLYSQGEVETFLSSFSRVDILISHNSPNGVHEQKDNIHFGFTGLSSYIKKAKPKYLIHGHQHITNETSIGNTQVIGVYGYKVIVEQ